MAEGLFARRLGPTGVEPARPCGHKALNLARLPIPPRARERRTRARKCPGGEYASLPSVQRLFKRWSPDSNTVSVQNWNMERPVGRTILSVFSQIDGQDCPSYNQTVSLPIARRIATWSAAGLSRMAGMHEGRVLSNLMAVDIGNSRVKLGQFRRRALLAQRSSNTGRPPADDHCCRSRSRRSTYRSVTTRASSTRSDSSPGATSIWPRERHGSSPAYIEPLRRD